MGVLVWACGFFYGGDVHRLGDPQFHVRHAAGERLKAAGWLAYPVLLPGFRSANAERANRCGELLDGLDERVGRLVDAEGVARGHSQLPEGADEAFVRLVCRRVDALGGWRTADCWGWVKATPYQHGSLAADCRFAVREAAAGRASRLLPTLSVPLKMPIR